jgi:type II secretory pathway component GspD/PulD (secretin)
LGSYYYHLALAREFRGQDKKEEAVREYNITLSIFPGNKRIKDELDTYVQGEKKRKPPFKSTITPPVNLKVDPTEKITLNLRNTPIKQIFKVLGKSTNVNFIFDKDFRDFVYTIEIEDIGFYEVLNQLCMVGGGRYRVLDPSSVLVYPDTTFKKRTFGLRGVKVFFLSNVKAEDAKKLVMTVFRDQQILAQEDKNLNTLIIKADDNTLRGIERFLYAIDKGKGEVEIDVEILELNRNLIQAIGLDYGTTLSTLSAGKVKDDGTLDNTLNVNDLGKTNFFMTLPSAALQFLETDDNTRILSKPNLRGVEGEEIEFSVGDDIPIPQTSFQAGAAGGFSNIPVTSYQYRSVGVEIKITPFVHRSREVTLEVKLKLDYITGYRGDFPTLGKRELKSIIRLKEGESSIIGGFIKDEMRGSLKGMPGLAKIPVLGRLFGAASKGVVQTDLVFSVTPRVIREVEVTEEDMGAIWSVAQGGQSVQSPAPPGPGQRRPAPGRNTVVISPRKRKAQANSVVYFTIRVNSTSDIASLSLNGSVSGGKAEIEELKTDFIRGKDSAKVLANTSGDSFDLGYTFDKRTIRNATLAQLKIKFLEEGNYTLSINSVSAFTKDRKQLELTPSSAEIEVFGGKKAGERRETQRDERKREQNRAQREKD